jgi:hypothetical protein
MVPTPPLYYGFTMTVWGKPPASIDPSEVYEVSGKAVVIRTRPPPPDAMDSA